MEPILQEWEDFARSLGAITSSMNAAALRDHAEKMLKAIAADMETRQSSAQQEAKSRGRAARGSHEPPSPAATTHGALRAGDGFTLIEMVSEYRALRASVLRLWARREADAHDRESKTEAYEQQIRFNEAIDEALADSIVTFARAVDQMFVAKARRRMESLGTLAAGLGHDMGNVLAPMQMCLMTLTQKGITPETMPMVEALERAVDHLAGLTRGLRSLSMDPEDWSSTPEVTNLQEWWTTAISPFTWSLPKGVHLHVEGLRPTDPPLPPVRMPAHVLMQAVFNLVQNAAQAHMQNNMDNAATHHAAPTGNIWVTAAIAPPHSRPAAPLPKPAVPVSTFALPEQKSSVPAAAAHPAAPTVSLPAVHMVRLTVRDDGPGMDESTVLRCMDPFFTTKSKNLASGLGLYVVRTVVERHGGKLMVESTPGEGSLFTLILPIAHAEALLITRSISSAPASASTP